MREPIITVKNISKSYNISHELKANAGTLSVRDAIMNTLKKPKELLTGHIMKKEKFWALKDINFEINKGEVVGIIGKNGSGKSTLLKIMSRITEPTTGEIVMNGRVASLLEVGTGFHPELTGRENVYFNGSILGMKKKEIDSKFDEIVAFSEVEKFLDTPVKFYSSGMYVRLAFAVAAHLDPDILIIDEVLAVGDAAFQKKCLGKMQQSASEGRTVLFVSHNMQMMRSLCTKATFMEKGRLKFIGNIDEVIDKYLDSSLGATASINTNLEGTMPNAIKLKNLKVNNKKPVKLTLDPSDEIIINVEYEVNRNLDNFQFSIGLHKDDVRITTLHSPKEPRFIAKGHYSFKVKIPAYLLRPGEYIVGIGGEGLNKEWAWNPLAGSFKIREVWSPNNPINSMGIINIPDET